MKKIILITFLIFSLIKLNAQCPNGGFEDNSFTNWQAWTGINSSGILNLSTFIPGIDPSRHAIVGNGTDPVTGIPTTINGNYSLRLGNDINGGQAEIVSYTFTVTASNASFRYALILQDGGHPANVNPFFSYWISLSNDLSNSTSSSNLIFSKKIIANSANPFFEVKPGSNNSIVFKNWEDECIPVLANYIGQTVTIYFATADCSDQGHYGYAYIDGLCETSLPVPNFNIPNVVCNTTTSIIADGQNSMGERDHYWQIYETDASGIAVMTGTSVNSPVYLNQPVGLTNIQSIYQNGGKTFLNGRYYKVILYVRNCNGVWVSTSQQFRVVLPQLTTSGNVVICCGSSVILRAWSGNNPFGGPSEPVTNFKWYDENNNFLGNGIMSGSPLLANYSNRLTVTPNKSTKYKLVYEKPGCDKIEKWIYVTTYKTMYSMEHALRKQGNVKLLNPVDECVFPKYITFQPQFYLNCDGTNNNIQDLAFHMNAAESAVQYQWSTGSTANHIYTNPNMAYWVKITLPCGGLDTIKFTTYKLEGAIPNVVAPNALSLSGTGGLFHIYQVGLPANAWPAYNAWHAEFKVFNRWGQEVVSESVTTPFGFWNGRFFWNGMYNNGGGSYVDVGVYSWSFKLKNCSTERVFGGEITVVP